MHSFSLSLLVCLWSLIPTIGQAATLLVPGDHATVSAAIEAAATGDLVEITDSGMYLEDLDIRKVLTVRGATGQRPIIRAANTAERFTHLGIGGADRLGALLRAPGIVMENLTFENIDVAVNSEGVSSAISILAPNCVVRGCQITSVPESGDDALGGVVADLDAPAGGTTPTGVLIEDCLIETNNFGFAVSWFVFPQNPPQATFRGCTFTGNSDAALTLDSGNVVIENCLFEDNTGDGLNVGGGHAEVSDSIFRRNASAGDAAIVLSLDSRWDDDPGAIPPGSVTLNRCRVYENGEGSGTPAAGVLEGSLTVDHCIFAFNWGPHIRLDDGGVEAAPGEVRIDHSDFYLSTASSELLIVGGGTQTILFDIKNSIVTEADGGQFVIRLEPPLFPDPDQHQANYCAFYEQAIPFIEIDGENNLLFPTGVPAYNSTDPTLPDAFTLPEGNALLSAGEGGTYLGSQGAGVEPEPVTLSISVSAGLPTLSWVSQNGVTYDVRERTDLVLGDWAVVETVEGDGTAKSWTPSAAPTVNTYWQLLAR